jgi:hypothetical protein
LWIAAAAVTTTCSCCCYFVFFYFLFFSSFFSPIPGYSFSSFFRMFPGAVPVSSPLDRPVTVQVVVAGSFPQIPTSASFSNFFFFPAPFPLLAD